LFKNGYGGLEIMTEIHFTLSEELTSELRNRAKKLGLPVSGHIRQIIQDSFKSRDSRDQKKKEGEQKEVLFAIEALIPIFIEALAQTSAKVPPEKLVEQVTTILLKKWKNKMMEIRNGGVPDGR
jgi:hypothetical protein